MYLPPKGALSFRTAYRAFVGFAVCAATSTVCAQQSLTLDEAIELGLLASPQIRAAQDMVEAAKARVGGAKAGFNPQIELAPGVGFTNGNSVLSQQFDIGGVGRARTALANAEVSTAEAQLRAIRQARGYDIAVAYYDLVRARAEEAAAAQAASLASQLLDLVQKRVEIGEAAEIQATRAHIEAGRSQQDIVRARGAVLSRLSVLKVLLNDQALTAEVIPMELAIDLQSLTAATALSQALEHRAEVVRARSAIDVARAELQVATSHGRPTLSAGISSDVWSLDRDPFHSRNLGAQAFFSFPLFDRGSLRADERRARLLIRASESDLAGVELTIRAELIRLLADLQTRQQVAANYRESILPQTASLVEATRKGYEAGLVTLIEVIDAQRTARLTQSEYLTALQDALKADLELRRATGTLVSSTSQSQEKKN